MEHPDLVMKWTVITPELAREMLTHSNPVNRKIDDGNITKYTFDILQGNWNGGNGETIKFCEDGMLADGHHRLSAIVKADKAVGMYVVRGLRREDIATIDRGKSRTVRDVLTMQGFESDFTKKAVISAVNSIFRFVFHKSKGVSDIEIGEFIKDNGEQLVEACKIADTGKHHNIFNSAYIHAAIFCALKCHVNKELLEEFFKVANTGFYEGEHQTAAIALRNMMMADRQTIKGKNNSWDYRRSYFEFTQIAIRDFVNKKPRKNRYTTGITLYSDGYKLLCGETH